MSDKDYSDEFMKEEAAEIYLDWLSEQYKNDVRMMTSSCSTLGWQNEE